MMTLKQYVEIRQSSDTTVKCHIKKLGLTLPENPTDKRSRLISVEHQQRLDASIGVSPLTPIAIDVPAVEVIPYQRSEGAQQAIAAAKRIKLIEAAQQEAFEAHQLKKQLTAQATTDLELMAMGLSVNPDPTPQTRPQSQPSESQPSWL